MAWARPGVAIEPWATSRPTTSTPTAWSYDAIDPLNRIDQYTYDSHGNVTTHIVRRCHVRVLRHLQQLRRAARASPNANGHTTYYTYDGHGNLTVIQDPLTNLTTMTYTGNGRVQTVTDANDHTTTYQYDSQDRLTTMTNADGDDRSNTATTARAT